MTTPADRPDALTAFLRARHSEEHALAARLAERYVVRNPDHSRHGQPFWPLPSVEASFRNVGDLDIAAGLDLIKLYDPARVLRQVERDRRILDLHAPVWRDIGWLETDDDGSRDEAYEELEVCGNCVPKHSHYPTRADVPTGPCLTVRLLALSYAEHPDYQERWRP